MRFSKNQYGAYTPKLAFRQIPECLQIKVLGWQF
jgi:hypothetical protein